FFVPQQIIVPFGDIEDHVLALIAQSILGREQAAAAQTDTRIALPGVEKLQSAEKVRVIVFVDRRPDGNRYAIKKVLAHGTTPVLVGITGRYLREVGGA